MLEFTSTGFILIVLSYALLHLLTMSAKLMIITFFDTRVIYLKLLFPKILVNLSATTEFPFVTC